MNNNSGNIFFFNLFSLFIITIASAFVSKSLRDFQESRRIIERNLFLKETSEEIKNYTLQMNRINKMIKILFYFSKATIIAPKISLSIRKMIKILQKMQIFFHFKYNLFLIKNSKKLVLYLIKPKQIYHSYKNKLTRNIYGQAILKSHQWRINSFYPLPSSIKYSLKSNTDTNIQTKSVQQ